MKNLLFVLAFVLVFPAAYGSSVSVTPGETAFFDQYEGCSTTRKYGDFLTYGSKAACEEPTSARALTFMAFDVFEREHMASARNWVSFNVPSSDSGFDATLDAIISADVDWDGLLFGGGFLGANATVEIKMILTDETRGTVVTETTVVKEELTKFFYIELTAGGHRTTGSEIVTLSGPVTQGHDYRIDFKLTCKSRAGAVYAVAVGCLFNDPGLISDYLNSLPLPDHIFGTITGLQPYAAWTDLSVTLGQNNAALLGDVIEKLNEMQTYLGIMSGKLNAMDSKLDGMQDYLGVMDGKLDGTQDHLGVMDAKLDSTQDQLGVVDGKLDELKEIKKLDRKN